MKEPQSVKLKLMILLVVGAFATALNLTIGLQETIGFSWWALGRPARSWLGWPTHALFATAISVVGLFVGYQLVTRRNSRVSIDGLIIVSAVSSTIGLVVYSLMAPITDLRFPGDLRSYYSEFFFSLAPEQLAQLTANMGVGAIAGKLFSTDDPRTKGERPTAGP